MMRRQPLFTIALCLNLVAIAIFFAWFMPGCKMNWSEDSPSLTLEQKGVLIQLAAKNAVIQAHNQKPGEWEDPVCSLATITLKALDGDEAALHALGILGADPAVIEMLAEAPATQSSITIPTKDFLLDLLTLMATRYGLGDWEQVITDGITIFDTFIISGVTTEHEVWFLTREFFAGIVDGCASCGLPCGGQP